MKRSIALFALGLCVFASGAQGYQCRPDARITGVYRDTSLHAVADRDGTQIVQSVRLGDRRTLQNLGFVQKCFSSYFTVHFGDRLVKAKIADFAFDGGGDVVITPCPELGAPGLLC